MSVVDPVTGEIDYDQAIMLDAEDLAETGIAAAYAEIAPVLREHGVEPAPLREVGGQDAYAVECLGRRYEVYGPASSNDDSWGLATFAFFDLVNVQLAATAVRLFALNGGNDLFGVVLTPDEARRATAALPRPADRPYLPTPTPPWWGMPRD